MELMEILKGEFFTLTLKFLKKLLMKKYLKNPYRVRIGFTYLYHNEMKMK